MSKAGDQLREAAGYADEAVLAAQRGDQTERDRLLGLVHRICAQTAGHIEYGLDPVNVAIEAMRR